MTTFKELFENLQKEIDASKIPPNANVDMNIYRRTAEQIALNCKSSAIIIAILIAAAFGATTLMEELRISKRNHIIAKQRRELSMPRQDSVVYKCPHCLQDHSLRLLQDSTINPFN